MPQRKGRKISEADAAKTSVIEPTPEALPAFVQAPGAGGGVDYPCAGCGVLIAQNIWEDTLHAIAVRCPKCTTITFWD